MGVTIRAATSHDVEAVTALHQEATAWLASLGTDQWQARNGGPPSRDRITQLVSQSVQRGTCYVAYENDELAGTITVDTYADPEFWTEDDEPDRAVYIHRMIVRRSRAGKGLGRVLLEWASELADKMDRPLVRLDAWSTNTALHEYYRRQGFRHVRTVHYPHRGSGALFEKPAR